MDPCTAAVPSGWHRDRTSRHARGREVSRPPRPRSPHVSFLDDAHRMHDELAALRLHTAPTPNWYRPAGGRSSRSSPRWDGCGLELTKGESLTSVTAALRGARPGHGACRAVTWTGCPWWEYWLEYAFATNGAMHACGHDLHTAALVGAAEAAERAPDELAGNIVHVPAGEEGPGAPGP
ncbi:M20/M25/M40 family metallo-hydrolase [Kocuria rhizophila]|nr:M20/M25/M40 family metallo-hydrolase [Kocuria rhizophila]